MTDKKILEEAKSSNTWWMIGGAILVIAVVGVVYYQSKIKPLQIQAAAIRCRSNLKQIGLGARIWANDHKEKMPSTFLEMKEELPTPRFLACPLDKGNPLHEARGWDGFDPARSSYEIVSPGMDDGEASRAYARCKLHDFACRGDGSVRE